MKEFYTRKKEALHEAMQSHIRTIERALESMKEGDTTTTTATNIVNAGAQLVSICAELNAFSMAEQIASIKEAE